MTFALWAAFAATEFGLSLVPGPAVLLVCSQALRFGWRGSLRGALGIIAGNVVYFGLAAAGLGALLLASVSLFEIVKLGGAAYLVWIGARMVFRRAEPACDLEPVATGRCFVQGLLTQLGNPKALVFFTALLPQFVATGAALPPQFLVLGATSIALELPILAAYGWLTHRGRRHLSGRRRRVAERGSGAILVGIGLSLALRGGSAD